MTRAVVFAYHDVGCECLNVLIRHSIDIALVVTHTDNPNENIWFGSVEKLARARGIEVATPDDPNTAEFIARVAALKPDFLFSFYYRMMLSPALLATAARGAFNMHGSLLPKYRGRVPINWAVLKGETVTGATLHEMVEKPDAGRIVDQQAVAILPDDTAHDVFKKVTHAAAMTLDRALPRLVDGSAELKSQDLKAGSYYGGRKPEDGIINWNDSAVNIHNLVRAVAPPYPGATTTVAGKRITITRTSLAPPHLTHANPGCLNVSSSRCIALCGDGRMLRVLEAEIDGKIEDEATLCAKLGVGMHPLGIY
jgi:methionyl-tRNA formyltransferase